MGNTVSVAADHLVSLVISFRGIVEPTSVQHTSDMENVLFIDGPGCVVWPGLRSEGL